MPRTHCTALACRSLTLVVLAGLLALPAPDAQASGRTSGSRLAIGFGTGARIGAPVQGTRATVSAIVSGPVFSRPHGFGHFPCGLGLRVPPTLGLSFGHSCGWCGCGWCGRWIDTDRPIVVIGGPSVIDPALEIGPPPQVEIHGPPEDPARLALAFGDYEEAAGMFAQRVAVAVTSAMYAAPDADGPPAESGAGAQAALAVALLADGLPREAAAGMLRAFEIALERGEGAPVIAETAYLSDSRLRTLLTRSVIFAHRAESPQAFLLAAAMMHASGRTGPCERMLSAAAAAGLDPAIVVAARVAWIPATKVG